MRAGGARFLARRARGARVTLVRERGGQRKCAEDARVANAGDEVSRKQGRDSQKPWRNSRMQAQFRKNG